MINQPAEAPRSGIEILIAWANEQDHWVRAIASEVIAVRRELPEKSVAAAFALLLAEKGLSADAPPNVPPLSEASSATEAADDLRLVRLSGLAGVNALASGQEIAFNAKITVLFGENAAGKTGYVRVLKRVAAVRSAQPILANVRGAASGKPHATIDYSLSGSKKALDWNDEVGVPPFNRMSVFDSSAVALHVDDDLTYVFTPGELALFLYVHRAVEAVKGQLEREKNDAQPKASNPFLHRFPRDPVVYSRIETLGPASSIPELEGLADVSSDEKDSIRAIRDRVEALQPRTADGRLQVATSDRNMYGALRDAAHVAASFPWAEYNAAVADVRAAEERYLAASQLAFAGTDIPAIFGEAWKDFIVAGEAYLRDVGAHDHVDDGDSCPYCRQGLSATAISLVQKYRDFCNNEPKKMLDAAAVKAKRLAAPISSLQIATLKGTSEQRQANFTDAAAVPPALPKAITFLKEFEPVHADVSAARATAHGRATRDTAESLEKEFATAAAKADEAIADLRKQADERKKELDAETVKVRVLENRITLQALLPEVRKYVERAQWAGRAAPLLSRATAVLRSLTEQSKLASKELLDKDFERLFEAECRALRAPTVRLDFAGRRGQAARKKTLGSEHRLSDILSEGEQKVIALADFLAEAGLHRTIAPVIFDDPVNSLDYKRLQHVVDRLVDLSATRQVVVFTHNIWFATEILSRFEKSTADCTYYGVSESGATSGVVNRGSHPRWDTVKNLSGRINQLAQGAGAATGEAQAALVESAYGEIRSWCEVVVEQEMLAGVTQRYQPNVAMTKLPQIKADKFVAARDVILPLFEKACRIMTAHSQPLETLAVRPTLPELKTDWASAQQARDAYLR